jgi:hypothetical protein
VGRIGATVSELYVDSNAKLTGTNTVHNLEVKLTINGISGSLNQWRVSLRY